MSQNEDSRGNSFSDAHRSDSALIRPTNDATRLVLRTQVGRSESAPIRPTNDASRLVLRTQVGRSEKAAEQQKKSPATQAISDWLVTRLAEVLGVSPQDIDIREPLTDFGLTSRDAVGLSGDLEEWLGRRLSPTLAYEYPTVEALARYLGGEPGISQEDIKESAKWVGETEPIAIVGIGWRVPAANAPE